MPRSASNSVSHAAPASSPSPLDLATRRPLLRELALGFAPYVLIALITIAAAS